MGRRRCIVVGALLGAALSSYVGWAEWRSIAAGQNPAGAGFATSHLLFFVSLPWSAPVIGLAGVVGRVTGADGPAFLRPFFYAMPVVAGAGWGLLWAVLRRGRSSRPVKPATSRRAI